MAFARRRESASSIWSEKSVKPSRQPYGPRAEWIGFRQAVTFMRSDLFTVARSVIWTPARSRGGLPLGKLSSMTRYCGPSAFTKGAI